jgi:hypothetical protein
MAVLLLPPDKKLSSPRVELQVTKLKSLIHNVLITHRALTYNGGF